MLELAVRVKLVKLFHSNLAVLDCVCIRGSHNRILVGERCMVHVQSSAIDVRLLCEKIVVDRSVDGGRWVEVDRVLVFGTSASRTLERNRRGVKLVECDKVVRIQSGWEDVDVTDQDDDVDDEESDVERDAVSDKDKRHGIFALWLVKTYGRNFLSTGSGVLDVAGGNGELSRALSGLGVPVVLLDPEPRCGDEPPFETLAFALHGDGRILTDRNDRTGNLIRCCSIIVGMHPDQATEPILDMALRLGVPFAILPCCVMPSLFPDRRQKRCGDPVRSYSAFCKYLLDKAPAGVRFRLDYLPFVGRNKVIFLESSPR
jgi:hypothetical protein